ncbi:MAG: hypothetical protein AAF108_02815 [Planctomycetota bacterium]
MSDGQLPRSKMRLTYEERSPSSHGWRVRVDVPSKRERSRSGSWYIAYSGQQLPTGEFPPPHRYHVTGVRLVLTAKRETLADALEVVYGIARSMGWDPEASDEEVC